MLSFFLFGEAFFQNFCTFEGFSAKRGIYEEHQLPLSFDEITQTAFERGFMCPLSKRKSKSFVGQVVLGLIL